MEPNTFEKKEKPEILEDPPKIKTLPENPKIEKVDIKVAQRTSIPKLDPADSKRLSHVPENSAPDLASEDTRKVPQVDLPVKDGGENGDINPTSDAKEMVPTAEIEPIKAQDGSGIIVEETEKVKLEISQPKDREVIKNEKEPEMSIQKKLIEATQNASTENKNDSQKKEITSQIKKQVPKEKENKIVVAEPRTSGEFNIKLILPPDSHQKLKQRIEMKREQNERRRGETLNDQAEDESDFIVPGYDLPQTQNNLKVHYAAQEKTLANNDLGRGQISNIENYNRRSSRSKREPLKSTILTRRSRRKKKMEEQMKVKSDEELVGSEDENDEDYEEEALELSRKERVTRKPGGSRPRGRPRGSKKKKEKINVQRDWGFESFKRKGSKISQSGNQHGIGLDHQSIEGAREDYLTQHGNRIDIQLRQVDQTTQQHPGLYETGLNEMFGQDGQRMMLNQTSEVNKRSRLARPSVLKRGDTHHLSSESFLEHMVMNTKGTSLKIQNNLNSVTAAGNRDNKVEGYLGREWESDIPKNEIYYQDEAKKDFALPEKRTKKESFHRDKKQTWNNQKNYETGNEIVNVDIMGKKNFENQRAQEQHPQTAYYNPKPDLNIQPSKIPPNMNEAEYYGMERLPNIPKHDGRVINQQKTQYGNQTLTTHLQNEPPQYLENQIRHPSNITSNKNPEEIINYHNQTQIVPNQIMNPRQNNTAYQSRNQQGEFYEIPIDLPPNEKTQINHDQDYEFLAMGGPSQKRESRHAEFTPNLTQNILPDTKNPEISLNSIPYQRKESNPKLKIQNPFEKYQKIGDLNEINQRIENQNPTYPHLEENRKAYVKPHQDKNASNFEMETFNIMGSAANNKKQIQKTPKNPQNLEQNKNYDMNGLEAYPRPHNDKKEDYLYPPSKQIDIRQRDQFFASKLNPNQVPYQSINHQKLHNHPQKPFGMNDHLESAKPVQDNYYYSQPIGNSNLQKRSHEQVYPNHYPNPETLNLKKPAPKNFEVRKNYLEPQNDSDMRSKQNNLQINPPPFVKKISPESVQANNLRSQNQNWQNEMNNISPNVLGIPKNNTPQNNLQITSNLIHKTSNPPAPDSSSHIDELYQKKQIYPHPSNENLSEDNNSRKKAKPHSNPQEKVSAPLPLNRYGVPENSKNQIQSVQIGLFNRPQIEMKSEELGKEKNLNQNHHQIEPPVQEERMVNMDIDVNIEIDDKVKERAHLQGSNYPNEQNNLDVRVRPIVGLEINGRNREELVRRCGLPQRINKIETIFENSDVQNGASVEQQTEMEMEKNYLFYQNYKTNMGQFLDFEVARERIRPPQGMKRLHFISNRGGVDKNFWLNYYCSLMRKGGSLNNSDIIKGKLNCLSFSLKEYMHNYNHKGHQAVFNMGKYIYRMTKSAVLREEEHSLERPNHEYQEPHNGNYYNRDFDLRRNQNPSQNHHGDRIEYFNETFQNANRQRDHEEYSINRNRIEADHYQNIRSNYSQNDLIRQPHPSQNRNLRQKKDYLEGNRNQNQNIHYGYENHHKNQMSQYAQTNRQNYQEIRQNDMIYRSQQRNNNYLEQNKNPVSYQRPNSQMNVQHQPQYHLENEPYNQNFNPQKVPFNNLPLQGPQNGHILNPKIETSMQNRNDYMLNFNGMHPPSQSQVASNSNLNQYYATEQNYNRNQNLNPNEYPHLTNVYNPNQRVIPQTARPENYPKNQIDMNGMPPLHNRNDRQQEMYLTGTDYHVNQDYKYGQPDPQRNKNNQPHYQQKTSMMQPSIENIQMVDVPSHNNNSNKPIKDSKNQLNGVQKDNGIQQSNNKNNLQVIDNNIYQPQKNEIQQNIKSEEPPKVNLDIQKIDNEIKPNKNNVPDPNEPREKLIDSDLNSKDANEIDNNLANKRRTRSRARSRTRERLATGLISTDKELKIKMEMEMKLGEEEEEDDAEESSLDDEFNEDIKKIEDVTLNQNIEKKEKPKSHSEGFSKKTGLIKQSSNGKVVEKEHDGEIIKSGIPDHNAMTPPEPESDNSKEWREYFANREYQSIGKGTRAYNKISKNFSFGLHEVLEMQDRFNDELFERENEDMTAPMPKLNNQTPFSKYLDIPMEVEDFKKGHKELEENKIPKKEIRELGLLRFLSMKHLGLNPSLLDMQKFVKVHQNFETAKEIIQSACKSTKQYLTEIKSKRLGKNTNESVVPSEKMMVKE